MNVKKKQGQQGFLKKIELTKEESRVFGKKSILKMWIETAENPRNDRNRRIARSLGKRSDAGTER